jgi:hypothetical protein
MYGTENGLILIVDRIKKYGGWGRSRLQREINLNENKGFGAKIFAQYNKG